LYTTFKREFIIVVVYMTICVEERPRCRCGIQLWTRVHL